MCMKKIILTLLAVIAVVVAVAEEKKDVTQKEWVFRVAAGYNLGGTAPLPLPREIRSIDGFNPGLNYALEGSVQKRFVGTPWGVMLGLRLETKGMETDARVKNYHMEAVNSDGNGKVVGAWTGMVKTRVKNNYISMPILATYSIGNRWTLSAGPYIAWMFDGEFTGEAYDGYIRDQNPTGEKAEVTSAVYDFSSSLENLHYGVQAGGEYRATERFALYANLQWGLNGIFPNDFGSVTFDLYPIYATLGFAYMF